jgi:hypothetical protein
MWMCKPNLPLRLPSCIVKILSNRSIKWATLFAFEERECAKMQPRLSARHLRMLHWRSSRGHWGCCCRPPLRQWCPLLLHCSIPMTSWPLVSDSCSCLRQKSSTLLPHPPTHLCRGLESGVGVTTKHVVRVYLSALHAFPLKIPCLPPPTHAWCRAGVNGRH